ncbi:hypothetical protein CYY_001435 [Polysphondylium violaceum]|uniref:Bicarbonate transporter-like transmembrane domain-containing protein n=1 Tax=Polysphondylium violaceum TaxID=133409 RepID=A0A8J4Q9C8_9MYCE|nr:hypothetical protein CYY_001435 [Polysphondylium violaceum]
MVRILEQHIVSDIDFNLDLRARKDLEKSKRCLHFHKQHSNNSNNDDNSQSRLSIYNILSDVYNTISSDIPFLSFNDFIQGIFEFNHHLQRKETIKEQDENNDNIPLNIINTNDQEDSDNEINIDTNTKEKESFLLRKYIEVDEFLILSLPINEKIDYKYIFYKLNSPKDLGLSFLTNCIILIIGPLQIKPSKSVDQISQSFSIALHSSFQLQYNILQSNSNQDVVNSIDQFLMNTTTSANISTTNKEQTIDNFDIEINDDNNEKVKKKKKMFYQYLLRDVDKRKSTYWLDWKDGVESKYAISKTISCSVFLLFACLMPSIAFGVLNQNNTEGKFSVAKTIISQGIGGMVFSLLAGQPMVVLLSTAPLAIFIKITFQISVDNQLDFFTLYTWIGFFNGAFLILYSVFGLSRLMKYSSRFIEETFAVFITIAFLYDGIKPIVVLFIDHVYNCPDSPQCSPTDPLFTLLLSLVTLWICFKLSNFKFTTLFNSTIRDVISDYALFLGVFLSTVLRHSVFLTLDTSTFPADLDNLIQTEYSSLPVWAYFLALALGFLLSLLFFVDQNISSSLASAPNHNLKKINGYHLDLLVVGSINIVLSFLGLPWVHGALPHSALHVRALAQIQTIISPKDNSQKEVFISVQETRLSGFISSLLIFICLFLTKSVLSLIPVSVLYGVFWFLGVKALVSNQFFERIMLLITDQNRYPNTKLTRQVNQKKIHQFTCIQIIALLLFCFISFYPNSYLTAMFPLFISLLIPFKYFILPMIFNKSTLDILDGH